MRTVSACACARVQSRLNAAAAAAEVFSSVLREVGIVSSPLNYDRFFQFSVKYLENTERSQPAPALDGAPLVAETVGQADQRRRACRLKSDRGRAGTFAYRAIGVCCARTCA